MERTKRTRRRPSMVGSKTKPKSKKLNFIFNEKHKEYIRACRVNAVNVAEGAVRAGKTVDNVFAFADALETTPDKIHIATGSTMANAKLNIGECNGLGLEYIFRGRSRWGKFKQNECLYVDTETGQKIVIFAGASQANSFKKIRGNSYGLWIATEVNLHHESMIVECQNRQAAAKMAKRFWDLNPDNPKSWIYERYIDDFLAISKSPGGFEGGYNYQHFTIFDNATMTKEQIDFFCQNYKNNPILYARDIKGERIVIEGSVYPGFNEAKGRLLIDKEDIPPLIEVNVGIDWGVVKSKHAFVATGITVGYKQLIVLKSAVFPTDISTVDLAKEYVAFIKEVERKYGKRVNMVYYDSALSPLSIECINESKRSGVYRTMIHATKGEIMKRIAFTNRMISTERLRYTSDALIVKTALEICTWKPNTDKRLEDGSTDIDTLDAMEYSFVHNMRRFD